MNASRDPQRGHLCDGLKKPVPQPPQVLRCENCDEIASADDWIAGLGALLCQTCLENLMDTPEERL